MCFKFAIALAIIYLVCASEERFDINCRCFLIFSMVSDGFAKVLCAQNKQYQIKLGLFIRNDIILHMRPKEFYALRDVIVRPIQNQTCMKYFTIICSEKWEFYETKNQWTSSRNLLPIFDLNKYTFLNWEVKKRKNEFIERARS